VSFFPLVSEQLAIDSWELDLEHDLGAYVIEQPGGLFEFHSPSTGDTIFLHTQMPLNTAWIFRSDSTITAQITQRQQVNLFGTTPDSVLVIGLSDGNEIRLSQNHGMTLFPSFSAYFKGDSLEHCSITEAPQVRTIRDIYGWNPGDHFGTYEWKNNGRNYYTHFEVLSATVSPDGNDLTFSLDRRLVDIFPDVDTTETLDTVSFSISSATHPWLLLGSHEYYREDSLLLKLVNRIYADSNYSDLPTVRIENLWWAGNGANFGFNTWYDNSQYTESLGLNGERWWQLMGGSYTQYTLECYEIGNYAKLPCRDLDALVTSVEGPIADQSNILIYPNPSHGDFVVEWEQTSARQLRCAIYDLQGRQVWENPSILAGRKEQIELKTGLTAGIYILSLEDGGGWIRKKIVIQ
jgi:hypothetical protein